MPTRTVPFDEMIAALERLADRALADRCAAEALKEQEPTAVFGVRRHFVEQKGPDGVPWPPLKHPRPGDKSAPVALMDTLRLMTGVTASAQGDTITLTVTHPGARLQQFGGTVAPKNGQFLAIPATAEAKAVRRPRAFPEPLRAVVNKQGTGGVLLSVPVKNVGGAKPEERVEFYLTKSVTVAARPFLGFSYETEAAIRRAVMLKWSKAVWAA